MLSQQPYTMENNAQLFHQIPQKRSGDEIQGPQTKKPVDFSNLRHGVDYVTVGFEGGFKNVLMEDLQSVVGDFQSLPTTQFPSLPSAQSQNQVFSPPHTCTGTPYTPVQQPLPPRFFPNKQIRQPSVSTQQQQNTHQNLQQMQHQNQLLQSQIQTSRPSVLASNFKSQGGHFPSPNKSGMDHALVAKINKVHSAVFNKTHGLDAMSLKVDELVIDVLHENGLKADIRDIHKDITALKAQNIQVSVDGDQHNVINDRLIELMENNRVNKDKIELLTNIVHSQGKQIESLQLSLVATTAMFMANVVHITM